MIKCTSYKIEGHNTLYCIRMSNHKEPHDYHPMMQQEILMSVDDFTKKYIAPAIEAIAGADEEKLMKRYKEGILGGEQSPKWLPEVGPRTYQESPPFVDKLIRDSMLMQLYCVYHKLTFKGDINKGIPMNRPHCQFNCPKYGVE